MADILLWALVLIASYIIIVCYWLLAFALFPQHVERCQKRYVERPVRSTIAGLLTFVPLVFLSGAVGKVPHPAVKVFALVLGLATVLVALFGSAGLARRVGEGLPSSRDTREPWRRVWRGGLVLAITFYLPFVGWFLMLPWTLISGFGSFILSVPRRTRALAPAPSPVTPPPIPGTAPTP
ncbi:hypothetical protein ACXR0O_11900 [Verrucomicrobiota bacterium sgz303538]